MQWKIEPIRDGKILRVTSAGTLTLDDRVEMVKQLLAEAERLGGVRAFLVDHRGVTVGLSTLDIYYMPEINRGLGLKGNERAAILYTPQQADDARFYEARARNSGFNHRVFLDEAEAVAWLEQADGVRTGPGQVVTRDS